MPDDERALATELDRLGRIHARVAVPTPPPQLDETILARSRAAVRPASQSRRWWIPASVAATALIAFSLVTQIEREAKGGRPATPAVTTAPQAAVPADEQADSELVAAGSGTDAASAREAPLAETATPTGKRSVPPRQSMPRQAYAPAQRDEPLTDAPPPAAAGVAKTLQEPAAAAVTAEKPGAAAAPMTAEAWLEKIEALEAAGRTEEAARQRALLEKAYPGWLESRQGPH